MIGPSLIEARIYQLTNALKDGLKAMGAKLVTPQDQRFSAGVCIIEVPRERCRQVVDRLYQEQGIAGAPTGVLRLYPHIHNTIEHIERALEGVKGMRQLIP